MTIIKESALIVLKYILNRCDKEMWISPKTYKKFVSLLKDIEKDFKLFKY